MRHIPVAFATDNNYQIALIAIESLLTHAKPDTYYNIYILVDSTFLRESEEEMRNYVNKLGVDCGFTFLQVGNQFEHVTMRIESITRPTYFRLLLPDLLGEDKCIYLDTDVIVLDDLQELYDIDMADRYVAGVKAPAYILWAEHSKKDYCRQASLPDMDQYINAGVLVMNLLQMRIDGIVKRFMEKIHLNMRSQDQDIINCVCYGKICFLPFKYNVMTKYADWQIESYQGMYTERELTEVWSNPCIIHYADRIKPWNNLNCALGEVWWDICKKSFLWSYFYEKLQDLFFVKAIHQQSEWSIKPSLSSKKYIVYGAGPRAKRVVWYLLEKGIVPEFIVVSSKDKNPDTIEDIPVYALDEVKDILSDKIILIAVKEKFQLEVISNIVQYSFKTYVLISYEMEKYIASIQERLRSVDISVIIPVYNVEPYLRECLDSVVQQKYDSYEVICVNDGSSDNSLKILEEYREKYSKVRVFTKENGGLSSARNYGLLKAIGKYIYFLDSDDKLADDYCLSFLVAQMEENDLDVLYIDGKSIFEEEYIGKNRAFYQKAYQRQRSYGIYNHGYELLADFVRNADYYVQSSLQCLRKEYVEENKLTFVDGLLYEDNIFTFKGMMLANKVMHINKVVFLHRIRNGSIMQSKSEFKNFYSLYVTYQELICFCNCEVKEKSVDKEITSILNSIRNSALSMYERLKYEEKKYILNFPDYEQHMMNALFFPSVKIVNDAHIFPYHLFHAGDRIVIYGAGNIGKKFYYRAKEDGIVEVVGIVDSNALEMKMGDIPVLSLPIIKQMDYDYILIAVENAEVVQEIKNSLLRLGIPEYRIKWAGDVYFKDNYYHKSFEYQKFSNRLMQSNRKRFFLFMLPEHGNLGDYAIAIAEKQFFEDYFPEYELIRVTTNEWLELKTYFMNNIKKSDVLFITGGGFIGDMWTSFDICRDILQSFPQNRKILLPNTLTYYDIQNRDIVREDLGQIFSDHHTYMFFREKNSLKLCSDLGWGDRCYCFPDMVLYLQHEKEKLERNGKVLLCFRVDAEKVFQKNEAIKNIIVRNEIQYTELDTHKYRYISEPEGELYVNDLLGEFQKYNLVITDRLHGMLLAYVSGTPCIAFDNSTHKLSGAYEWIKESPDVTCWENYDEEKVEGLIVQYRNNAFFRCLDSDLSRQFFLMKEKIKELITRN